MRIIMTKQAAPFCVQIELTEGCTLSCDFCGINGIRKKPGGFKFMTKETLESICGYIWGKQGWTPRIEFAMHGEPSMHPQLVDMIRITRTWVSPKSPITVVSNATGFAKMWKIEDVLEAGANTVALDDYEGVNVVPRVIKEFKGNLFYYPDDKSASIHTRYLGKRVVVIRDISTTNSGNHSSLNSHCGGGMPPSSDGQGKVCAKPFRELAFRWDGSVALCCNDFRGVYRVGHVNDTDVWNDPRFVAARKKLLWGDRSFKPCEWCNAVSYRVGLLPDPKGEETMEPFNEEDAAQLQRAVAEGPLTEPVLREWEASGNVCLTVKGKAV